MAENKLKTALREVVSTEFAEIPRNEREINHSFSDDFLRRMDKLTHAQRSRFWRMTNTVPKRVAAVAAAFLLIALTACSIPSVRAAATKFIRETFDSYVHFFTEKSERRQITEHYRLTELPDGYAEEIVVKNDSCCISFYQNEAGDRIIFAQSVTEDFAIDVDVPDENIVKRMSGRRACLKCGATYHIEHVPPKKEGICDVCASELVLRDDDKPETVQKRLKVYHEQTQPLIDFYTKKGVLKEVDGTVDMKDVFQAITDILG